MILIQDFFCRTNDSKKFEIFVKDFGKGVSLTSVVQGLF